MDNWEKDKQFGVNDMENVDAGEANFGGLDPESGHTEPYTQVPSTESLKNRKRKNPQKENNVAKRPLLLDNYADCGDEFWKLWGKKMGAVFVEHRLLRGTDMNCEFWSSLLGIGSGWLLSEVDDY
ncbi:unnamed protein product [Lactuca saligna]|uniref:Uncharacterized protein n=1 Tax=Lactuca saligna TaxID=75948 RepID=A0AA35VE75_LACSI|nr:unnamed protein product [Lactuca saligna]